MSDVNDGWKKAANTRRKLAQPIRQRCKACGMKIRGPNHAEGQHHKEKAKW